MPDMSSKNHTDCRTSKGLFPVLIDLSEQTVLVIACTGKEEDEARLYLEKLAPCARKLCVLTPDPSEALLDLAKKSGILLIRKEYERSDLYGADLVVCTVRDKAVTDDVFAACKTLGIRLQITSQPHRSDYILALTKDEIP